MARRFVLPTQVGQSGKVLKTDGENPFWSDSTGAITYRGVLDASGGVYPTSPAKGDYYIISVAGTISGTAYNIGDWTVYNGTTWDKIDNTEEDIPPVVSTKTDNYNVALTDFSDSVQIVTLVMNSASDKAFNLPANLSTVVGKFLHIAKIGAGKVTVQANTGQVIADSSSAGTVYDDVVLETYANIHLLVLSATKLIIISFDGTWTTS